MTEEFWTRPTFGKVSYKIIAVELFSAHCYHSLTSPVRAGKKKKERKIEITGQKYNRLPYYIWRP